MVWNGFDVTGVDDSNVPCLMQRLLTTDASTRHQSMGRPTARRTGCQNLWPRIPEQRCDMGLIPLNVCRRCQSSRPLILMWPH